MFVGHYSASIFAKAVRPNTPFWILIFAAQLVDILWALFIYVGIEKVNINPSLPSNPLDLYYMPFTHSLIAMIFWSGVAFIVAKYVLSSRLVFKDLLVIAFVVASHWFLDLIVHRPDLHIANEIKIGFGLWEYPVISFFTEITLLIFSAYYFCGKVYFSKQNKLHIKILCIILIIIQIFSSFVIIPKTIPMLSTMALATFIGFSILAFFTERKFT